MWVIESEAGRLRLCADSHRRQHRVTENGRISEGMANVSRFRQAAIERLDRTAPAVRAAVSGTWEKTRPVIEHATAAMRERLNRVLGDYRQREDQRRAEERRQADASIVAARKTRATAQSSILSR
jgi:hypothetical protein